MINQKSTLPITDIVLDESIYPRARIDQKRVALFAENIRDGFPFDPIEVQAHPTLPYPANIASWTACTDGALTKQQA